MPIFYSEYMRKKSNGREDKLARMIHNEFAALHRRFDESPTNKDIDRIKEDITILRKDTETGFLQVTHVLKTVQEELKDLKGMDVEIASLRTRLARVERKVGISH